MPSIIWPLALTLIALPALLVAEYHGHRGGKWLFKPLASTGFVLTAWLAGAAESLYGQIILVGLLLSMAGDVLLIGRTRRAFLAGLIAFLLGHVAYAAGFIERGVDLVATLAAAAFLGLVCIWLGRRYLPVIDPAMRRPVIAYAAIISAMLALAVGTTVYQAAVLILAGATLFWLSDLSVAANRLIRPAFIQRAWGLPAYYFGQLLLALSIAY